MHLLNELLRIVTTPSTLPHQESMVIRSLLARDCQGVPHLAGAGEAPEEACSRARMTAAALKRSSADCAAPLSAAAKGSSHSAGGQKGLLTSLSYSSRSSLGAHSASILLAVLPLTPAATAPLQSAIAKLQLLPKKTLVVAKQPVIIHPMLI